MAPTKRKLDDTPDSNTETGRARVAKLSPTWSKPAQPSWKEGATKSDDDSYRDLYSREVSFQDLGKQDADFAAILNSNGQLDFNDPASVKQLTKSLLKRDFGLAIDVPDDRLCPPVPNRHNYILWLKELLDSSSYEKPGREVLGLDIGTGASCIYPLLGTAQRPWRFIGTDIDAESLTWATKNVRLNGLEDRISLYKREPTDALLSLDEMNVQALDFVMTNPPFYQSASDMNHSAEAKSRPPSAVCTGTTTEMICEGGEVGFVSRILEESLVLRDRVQWYTSMFGKAASVKEFVQRLHQENIGNYAVTEFVQGNKTRRWAVGWSFGPLRPAQRVSRSMSSAVWKQVLPQVTEVDLADFPAKKDVEPLINRITETLESLELISWRWDGSTLSGLGRAAQNTWGRAWKRKQKFGRENDKDNESATSRTVNPEVCKFGFKIAIQVEQSKTWVRLRWMEGYDQPIFESFRGFMQSKLAGS